MSYAVNWKLKTGDWRSVWIMEDEHFFNIKEQHQFGGVYDKIIDSVQEGETWVDPVEIEQAVAPTADGGTLTPTMVPATDIPIWKGQDVKLFKTELADGKATHFSDVCQGQLGNCWFMAGLAAVAQIGRVSELFPRYDEKKGVYEVKLWRYDSPTKSMTPLKICVDNRIALAKGYQEKPFYCYSDDVGELWPSLVEKAFAKAIKERDGKSGYAALVGGMTQIAVAHLLGGIAKVYKSLDNGQQPFNVDMLTADWEARMAMGHIVGVSFRKEEEGGSVVGPAGEASGSNGLVSGHAYTLLEVQETDVKINGDTLVLAKLRNPWGEMGKSNPNLEWKGDWSDLSPLWDKYPTVKETCNWDGAAADGVFWMAMRDVAVQAHRVQVAVPNRVLPLEDDFEDDPSLDMQMEGNTTTTTTTTDSTPHRGKGGGWHNLMSDSSTESAWPGARSGLAMATDGEKCIFVFGGCAGGPTGEDRNKSWTHYNDVWVYNTDTDVWMCWVDHVQDHVDTGNGPPPAMGAGAVVYDGYLYVFGGYSLRKVYDQLWRIPIATDVDRDDRKWEKLWPSTTTSNTTAPPKRNSFGMALVTNNDDQPAIILFGGFNGRLRFGDCWKWLLKAQTWQQIESSSESNQALPSARSGMCMCSRADKPYKAFLFGGYNSSMYFNDVWEYNHNKGRWRNIKVKGKIPLGRRGAAMGVINNRCVVFGGYNGGYFLNHLNISSRATNANQTVGWQLIPQKNPKAIPEARTIAGGVFVGQSMYIYGGFNGVNRLPDFWKYTIKAFDLQYEEKATDFSEVLHHEEKTVILQDEIGATTTTTTTTTTTKEEIITEG